MLLMIDYFSKYDALCYFPYQTNVYMGQSYKQECERTISKFFDDIYFWNLLCFEIESEINDIAIRLKELETEKTLFGTTVTIFIKTKRLDLKLLKEQVLNKINQIKAQKNRIRNGRLKKFKRISRKICFKDNKVVEKKDKDLTNPFQYFHSFIAKREEEDKFERFSYLLP